MTSMPEHTPQALVMVKIGGREYPLRREASCQVCSSPYRFEIERALVMGHTYRSIRESLPSSPEPPSLTSFSGHVTRAHMPLPQAATRQLIEHRAQQLGKEIEGGLELLLDTATVTDEVIQKGFQRLQDGEIEPSMSDLLKALTIRSQLDATSPSGDLSSDAWMEAMMEMFAIVNRLMPPELWESFSQEIANSPILKAISSNQTPIRGEVEQ